MEKWRWIDTGFADGATHMAMDQALLELAMDVGMPTMRVYRWDPACISLGFHQSSEIIDVQRCKGDGIDVVRRPTGGRAVYHAEEVTYAVVIPEGSRFYSTSVTQVYNLISQGLTQGIRNLGIPAVLQKRSLDLHNHYKTPVSVSCFSAAAKHEILLNGKKLVGSAQRRLPKGILQHGSILTGKTHLDLPRYLKGMDDEEKERMKRMIAGKTAVLEKHLGRTIEYTEVVEAIKKGMEERLSVRFANTRLTDKEERQAELLYQKFSVYSVKRYAPSEESLDESVLSHQDNVKAVH